MEDSPLKPLVGCWMEKIRLALDYKKKQFQDDADEAMSFFDGPYTFLYDLRRPGSSGSFIYTGEEEQPRPSFQMTVNKVSEMVQLFGPALYHKNPIRQVNPRKLPQLPPQVFGLSGGPNDDPNAVMAFQQMMAQAGQIQGSDIARATLLETYLNYTPTALDLKTESRWAIDECIIKGMGTLWHEVYQPPGGGGPRMFGSFFDSVDHLLIDPDAELLRDAKWIARRCLHPVWQVEQEYGLRPGSLRGNLQSYSAQAQVAASADGDYDRKRGLTNDLICYYKVFSKMGMGGRMKGIDPSVRDALEGFGNYCFLVLCEECPYPLNVPPELTDQPDQAIMQRVQWPTPFWADDAWPFTPMVFHSRPRCAWPISHLKPGLGELKFLNWVYSFLAGKIKTACRDFIAVAKSASEDIKNAITNGQDYTLIEIEKAHGGTISDVVQFLQHPQFQGDIWKVIEAVSDSFEKRVGLTELMYGQTPQQLRSATEANVKAAGMQLRPDDMANKIEDAMSDAARREALGIRWHLAPQDVGPILGPLGAQWWQQYVTPSNPSEILHQLEYRIEAGSGRKPNKDRDAQNMKDAMQNLLQPLFQYAGSTGNVGPVNALLGAWAKSIDLDADQFMLQPPPPPQPAPGPSGPPQPGGPPNGRPQ